MHATTLTAVACGSLLIALSRADGQQPAGGDPAVAAARARQEAVKTLSVEFRLTETQAPGAASSIAALPFKPSYPVPAQETALTSINKLVLNGRKVRYENNHPRWLMPDGKLQHGSYVCTFNGDLVKHLFPKSPSGEADPTGVIGRDARLTEVRSRELTPLTTCFRGLMVAVAPFPVDMWKPTGVSLPIDGATCREYVMELAGETDSFWLDGNRDYVVRRYSKRRDNRLAEQCDITYRSHEACGWVPISWVLNEFAASGTVTTTSRVEVLDLKVNAPQSAESFEIVFPEGCYVSDNRVVKNYQVQADGSMREISPSGQVLDEVVMQPGVAPWYRRHLWLLISLVGALVAAALALFVRKKRTAGV